MVQPLSLPVIVVLRNAVMRNKQNISPRQVRDKNFHEELSKVTLHTEMNIFILSYGYSYGYEISLGRIVCAANSRILHDKENTVRILGIRHPKLS